MHKKQANLEQKIPLIIFCHYFLFSLQADFGIDLCGDDAGMPEKFRYITKIGSIVKQLACKGMAKIMGSGVGVDVGDGFIFCIYIFNAVYGQLCSVAIYKNVIRSRRERTAYG